MCQNVDDEPIGYVSDLYIFDLNLPGEDGISLARRVRHSQPNAGIVIVSARNALQDRIDGYQCGANIYLTKPFSLDELRAVVSGCIRLRALCPSAVDALHGPACGGQHQGALRSLIRLLCVTAPENTRTAQRQSRVSLKDGKIYKNSL